MDAQDIPVSREDSADVGARKSGRQLPAAEIRDTAFSENRGKGAHRWTPWIAGFSGAFVGGVLERESPNGESLRVLDPFAGVGTTLVEAVAGGHDAVGFEINPYAALACDAKANVPAYDANRFTDAIARFRASGLSRMKSPGSNRRPRPRRRRRSQPALPSSAPKSSCRRSAASTSSEKRLRDG